MRLASQGRARGEPFHLEGHVRAWDGGRQPVPVQLRLRLGETRARLDGTLGQGHLQHGWLPKRWPSKGQIARLAFLLALAVPLPAYRVEGRLRHHGNTWTLKGLKVRTGASDLDGGLSLAVSKEGLALHGDLQSQRLVVDERTGYQPESWRGGPRERPGAGTGAVQGPGAPAGL